MISCFSLIKKEKFPVIFLLIWMVILSLLQIIWIEKDTLPPAWDQSHHLITTVEYTEDLSLRRWKELFSPHFHDYPPLYHWTLIPLLKTLDREPDAAGYLNIFYTWFLVISLFFLMRSLNSEEDEEEKNWTAVTGACFISSCPFLFYTSHFPLLDLALTSWSAFVLLALVKCRDFSERKWSILLGVGWACGMMTKWSFFFYAVFPTFWVIKNSFKDNRKNVLIFLSVLILLALPWYYPNLIFVLRRTLLLGGYKEDWIPEPFTWASWTWYLKHLPEQLGVFGLLIFITGMAWLTLRKKWFLIFGTILLPLLFWTLTRNKDFRFFLPMLPAFCAASVLWMAQKPRWIKFIALFFFAWQLGYSAFGLYGSRGPTILKFQIPLLGPQGARAPIHEDWQQKEILGKIVQLRKAEERWAILRTVSWEPYLSNISLRYAAVQNGWFDRVKPLNPSFDENFAFTDFILDHDLGRADQRNQSIIRNEKWFKNVFSEIGRWPLPPQIGETVLYGLNVRPLPIYSGKSFKKLLENSRLNPDLKAEKVSITLFPLSIGETQLGHFRKISVTLEKAEFRDFPLGEASADMEDIQLNLHLLRDKGEIQVLKMKTVTPYISVKADRLKEFVEKKAEKYLTQTEILLEDGRITISCLTRYHIGAEAAIRLSLDEKNRSVTVKLEKIKIGRITIPRFLYMFFSDRAHFFGAGPGMPFDLVIKKLEISKGKIQVN